MLKAAGSGPICRLAGTPFIILGIFLFMAQSVLRGQTPTLNFEKEGRFNPVSRGLSPGTAFQTSSDGQASQPFDMLHYQVDFSAAMVNSAFHGKCTMTMMLRSSVDSLVLNAVGLSFDTVAVDGSRKNWTMGPSSETFTIHLNGFRDAGDTLRIEVVYRRTPGYVPPNSRQGYYFYPASLGLPSNLGYTMSEPSDARFWLPCYDEPWDKATVEINITVPGGYTAASNGKLIGTTDNGNGNTTWHWREDHPIATYLVCVTVSGYTVSEVPYVTSGGSVVPIQYYAWKTFYEPPPGRGEVPDSEECAAYLPTVHEMVSAYSRIYGEYPFDKYGMTTVVPFSFGGMEHQSLTTLNRYYRVDERVVSHELAHSWWGDLVTCGTWPDIWLNESFATYSEALWKEQRGGRTALKSYMKNTLENFNYGSWSGAVYDPVAQGFNLFDHVVYSKGAWVLHTLRGVVGDSTFFRILDAYRQKFAGRNAVTLDFQSVADSVAGRDMGWFFHEWVFGKGWPEYASSFAAAGDTLLLRVYQRQDPAWPVYKMPIQVRASGAGMSSSFLIEDSLRTQLFRVPLAFVPDSVVLDPDGWILKKMVQVPVGVDDVPAASSFRLFQNYPNPFNPATVIRFSVPDQMARQKVSLRVFDLLGREVNRLVDEARPPGEYAVEFNASGLSSGIYIYRLQIGGSTLSKKMILVK